MSRITDDDRLTLKARELHLEVGKPGTNACAVRPEIAASWQRSIDKMINPSRALPDFQRLGDTKLSTAALPVIDHHLATLADTKTSLLLADAAGRLIGRWTHDSSLRASLSKSYVEAGFSMAEGVVGTNGVGTVFETGGAVEIKGPEHFSDQYLPFTCVGAPIRHPLTRRIVGVIDITCRDEDASPLAMSWIGNLARHIEDQLLDQATVRERALLNAYLVASRRSQVAVACLNGQFLICNPAASALLSDADHGHIWSHLQRHGLRPPATFTPLELPDGRVLMFRAKTVRLEGSIVGAVIEAYQPQQLSAAPHESTLPTRTGLAGLVGISDRWTNVCEQASAWREDSGGIVVTGEPGVGKLAVLKSVFGDAEALTVIDCNLVVVDGPQTWLAALRDRLNDARGLVVLRHVNMLDVTIAQTVSSMLDQTHTPPRLAATVISASDRPPFAPLIDRFEVHHLEVPPLRHRLDDLALLVADISQRSGNGGPRWLPDTIRAMADHPWPDNIRGLAAVVRRVLRTRTVGVVSVADLPGDMAAPSTTRRSMTQLERLERQEIIEALAAAGGNKVLAAKKLNLARSTLYRKMSAFGVTPPVARGQQGR